MSAAGCARTRVGDYWLNFGAHLFPAPGSVVDTMAREFDLETVPVTGSMMGLAVDDTKLDRGRIETYPLRLPLSARERWAFAMAGLKVQRGVGRYHRLATRAAGETAADVRARVLAFEDDRSFAEFLGPLPPAVGEIFACAARRATAELTELSAGCGIGLFALVWGGKGSLIARNLLGGTGRLPEALGRALGDRVRTRCRVTELRPEGEHVLVRYDHAGGSRQIRARQVVMAAQAPHAAALVAPVARRPAEALAQLTYGAFLSVAVETNETSDMPWDTIYAMATPGRAFDMFTNQAHARRAPPSRRPGGSLMLFSGADNAQRLIAESDQSIVDHFLDDLYALYPQSRGIVVDAAVHRWPLGNVYAKPGRHALQAALEGAHGEHRNLHLAGDYFAELGSMEAAARTGMAAADQVEALLNQRPRGAAVST